MSACEYFSKEKNILDMCAGVKKINACKNFVFVQNDGPLLDSLARSVTDAEWGSIIAEKPIKGSIIA